MASKILPLGLGLMALTKSQIHILKTGLGTDKKSCKEFTLYFWYLYFLIKNQS